MTFVIKILYTRDINNFPGRTNMKETEKLKNKVNEAYDAVSDLPDSELKLQGFKLVLGKLLNHTTLSQAQPTTTNDQINKQQSTDWESAISARLDISGEDVAKLYYFDGGEDLRLILDTKLLPKSQASATQDIAALISAGRQAAKIDENNTTSFNIIRKECTEYGVLNKSNFTAYLRRMKPKFIIEGKGKVQSMRVTAQGFDDATDIAKKYLRQGK